MRVTSTQPSKLASGNNPSPCIRTPDKTMPNGAPFTDKHFNRPTTGRPIEMAHKKTYQTFGKIYGPPEAVSNAAAPAIIAHFNWAASLERLKLTA